MQREDHASDQVLSAIFGQTRLWTCSQASRATGTRERVWTPGPSSSALDIESLREFDEGDELVSDTRGDLRALFTELVERFAELNLEIVMDKYWSRTIPPVGAENVRGDGAENEDAGNALTVQTLDMCKEVRETPRKSGA